MKDECIILRRNFNVKKKEPGLLSKPR